MKPIAILIITLIIGFGATFTIAQEDVDNSLLNIVWKNSTEEPLNDIWEMQAGFDIDQDGKGEFLVYSRVPSYRLVLFEATENDDDYQIIWSYDSPAITEERGVAVGDINVDGKDEIVLVINVPYQLEFAMKIFSWDGENDNGIPAEPNAEWDPPRAQSGAIDLETVMRIVNLDSDPEPEIVLPSNWSGFTQIVSFGGGPEGDMNNFDLWKAEFWDSNNGRSVTYGDLDNDGLLELYVNDQETKTITVIENTGIADQYEVVSRISPGPWGFDWSPPTDGLVAANFDGGYGELYFTHDTGKLYVITHDGDLSTITFENNATLLKKFSPGILRGIALGDQDSDGKPDIYIGAKGAMQLFNIEYQGGPANDPNSYTFFDFLLDEAHGGAQSFQPTAVKIGNHLGGDMDGDLKKEIVITSVSAVAEYSTIIVFEHPNEGKPASVKVLSGSPSTFALCNAYPNPFNPTTTIEYSIAKASPVRLAVYNSIGQKVESLVEEVSQDAGNYRVSWYVQGQPSGLYFYRIEAGDFIQTRKMVFVQ